MNYENLTLPELMDHEARIQKAIVIVRRNNLSEAKRKVREIAESMGFKLTDLVQQPSSEHTTKKVAVKYRDPSNPDHTWTGRGRMALWLKEKISKGADISDFRVQ